MVNKNLLELTFINLNTFRQSFFRKYFGFNINPNLDRCSAGDVQNIYLLKSLNV